MFLFLIFPYIHKHFSGFTKNKFKYCILFRLQLPRQYVCLSVFLHRHFELSLFYATFKIKYCWLFSIIYTISMQTKLAQAIYKITFSIYRMRYLNKKPLVWEFFNGRLCKGKRSRFILYNKIKLNYEQWRWLLCAATHIIQSKFSQGEAKSKIQEGPESYLEKGFRICLSVLFI